MNNNENGDNTDNILKNKQGKWWKYWKGKNIVLIITKNNLATALTSENNGQFLIKCKHQYIQQQ